MYKLSKSISWTEKKDIIVVYLNYNYYFFRNKSKNRIRKILENNKNNSQKDIPAEFYSYLIQKNILEDERK